MPTHILRSSMVRPCALKLDMPSSCVSWVRVRVRVRVSVRVRV